MPNRDGITPKSRTLNVTRASAWPFTAASSTMPLQKRRDLANRKIVWNLPWFRAENPSVSAAAFWGLAQVITDIDNLRYHRIAFYRERFSYPRAREAHLRKGPKRPV